MSSQAKPNILNLTHEQAYDAISALADPIDYSTDDATVWFGQHTTLGPVYVVVPPSGNSLLLPCAIQNFVV